MEKIMFGCILFIGGLLGLLLFPITSTIGPWTVSLDTISIIIFTFIVILISGFSICFYEAYIKKEL